MECVTVLFKLLCCDHKRDTQERLIYTELILVFTSNLEFSPYSEVIHRSITFKLTKGWRGLNTNDQLFILDV